MLSRHPLLLPFFVLLAHCASAQQVISARSGLVNFFEGRVFLGDQLLKLNRGRFPQLDNGSVLRTEVGRAELLLAPGVFLRLGENSSVRMVDNDLTGIQVEFLSGSLIVQSTEPPSAAPATLLFRSHQIRLAQPGSYRLDGEPARLLTKSGLPEVTPSAADPFGQNGFDFPILQAPASMDELEVWSQQRDAAVQNLPSGSNASAKSNRRHSGPYRGTRTLLPSHRI